jgi:hypothetical protein
MPRHRSGIALLCLTVVVAHGCGFVLSEGPPAGHERMARFTCTESNVGPALDLTWASLNLLGALAAASAPDDYDNPGQIVGVGLGWWLVSGSAAVVGFRKSRRCRAAKQLSLQQARRPAPPPAAPPAPPPAAPPAAPPAGATAPSVSMTWTCIASVGT